MTSTESALAAVEAALFAYSTGGGRLVLTEAATASRGFTELRATRDVLRGWLAADHAQAAAPPAAYDLGPLTDATSARTLLLKAEESLAAAFAVLVRDSSSPRRTSAATWLSASAVRAVGWRAALHATPTTVAFPGLSEPQ